MSKITTLKEIYIEELKELYNAEVQLTEALPKLAKAATYSELAQGFQEHLEQTKEHVNRLDQIFEQLGIKSEGNKCKGMEALIEEGAEITEHDLATGAKDALLIAAAQRVEHYEIAGYGTVKTFAELLGEEQAVRLLRQTLEEESETDEKLTQIAELINVKAKQGEDQEVALSH